MVGVNNRRHYEGKKSECQKQGSPHTISITRWAMPVSNGLPIVT
jgi:hypothetical protein